MAALELSRVHDDAGFHEERRSKLHGRGLFAIRNIPVQTVLYRERPVVAMQTLANRHEVLACAHCLAPLAASPEQHLSVMSGDVGLQEVASASEKFGCFGCARECGELYCCRDCRDSAWGVGHCLLCVGDVAEEEAESHPLIKFKIHAISTNEILLLTAAVVAHLVMRSEGHHTDDQGNVGPSFDNFRGSPFEVFVKNPWWEVAVAPPGTDAKELESSLHLICDESCALLKEAFGAVPGGKRAELQDAITPDLFASIIGMFEVSGVWCC
jgi:hypothetical protein